MQIHENSYTHSDTISWATCCSSSHIDIERWSSERGFYGMGKAKQICWASLGSNSQCAGVPMPDLHDNTATKTG